MSQITLISKETVLQSVGELETRLTELEAQIHQSNSLGMAWSAHEIFAFKMVVTYLKNQVTATIQIIEGADEESPDFFENMCETIAAVHADVDDLEAQVNGEALEDTFAEIVG